ncbi:hypothetical protein Tco_1476653 [Tanacetum coccineum]
MTKSFISTIINTYINTYTISHKSSTQLTHINQTHKARQSDDGLRGLSVVAHELLLIDIGELVKLNICIGIEGSLVDPIPVQAPQPPPPPPAMDDGYCNGGNLPEAYIVGNTLRYQDLEWYDALKDIKVKEEALKNKAIMEGMIDEDAKSSNEVCNIRRFEMIKYSFRDDEEYVAVKEDKYDDLTSTSKDACRAYQEIFRIMDKVWMVTRTE